MSPRYAYGTEYTARWLIPTLPLSSHCFLCFEARPATSTIGAPTKCLSPLTSKDSKTIERAATAYGKLNSVDLEDEQAILLDQILW
ncbi:MAG: hypothetical protein HDS80_05050 [Bacteroidales bacterium]|nr:hypothetical protein [Bacteroidales bacterium]